MRSNYKNKKYVIVLFLILFFSSFTLSQVTQTNSSSNLNLYVDEAAIKAKNIMVLKFKTEDKVSGVALSNYMVTALLKTGYYNILDSSLMEKKIREAGKKQSDYTNIELAVIAAQIGADAVVVGHLDEYGIVELDQQKYSSIALSVRLITGDIGKVLWSANHSDRTLNVDLSLVQLTSKLLDEITQGLEKEIKSVQPLDPVIEAKSNYLNKNTEGAILPPRNFRASDMGLREVILKWDTPIDKPVKYIIERSLTHEGPFKEITRVSPKKRKYVDKGVSGEILQDGFTYYYRMMALDKDGISSQHTEIEESFTAPPPDPPINLLAKANRSKGVYLIWQPPNSESVISYQIQRTLFTEPDSFKKIKEVRKKTFYQDGGNARSDLNDSTEYLYRVASINRVGSIGDPSDPVRVLTLPPPDIVQNFVAIDNQVRCIPLSWDINPESNIVKYIIDRSDTENGAFKQIASVRGREKTNYLDGGGNPGNLKDNHRYFYRIRAVNDLGSESPDSVTISSITRGVPLVVTGIQAVSGGIREVKVNWQISTDQKVIGYEVWRSLERGAYKKIATLKGIDKNSYLDKGKAGLPKKSLGRLEDGLIYKYQVFAINKAGAKSKTSHEANAVTKDVCRAPIFAQANLINDRQVEVVWSEVEEEQIKKYRIEFRRENQTQFKKLTEVQGSVLSYIDKRFSVKKPRVYRIQAIDSLDRKGKFTEELFVNLTEIQKPES